MDPSTDNDAGECFKLKMSLCGCMKTLQKKTSKGELRTLTKPEETAKLKNMRNIEIIAKPDNRE